MNKSLSGLLAMLGNRQHRRLLRLSFPNDDGPLADLVVNSIEAVEALSRPFEFKVELLSPDPDIELKTLQGKLLCIELVRGDGSLRYFTGYVFSFRLNKADGGICYYEATLGPWLRYLELRKDNFLFHDTTLYDQTHQTFSDYADLAQWDWRVKGAEATYTDCCQFDETDANFLQRRWLSAGIIYWFEHTATGHTLVLSDDTPLASPVDGTPTVRFQKHGGVADEDSISQWTPVRDLVESKITLAAFDFKSPRPVMEDMTTVNRQGDVPAIESYEYAGAYGFKDGAGGALAELRMEEIEAAGKRFEGASNSRYLIPGRWFELTGHFDASQLSGDSTANQFFVTDVVHVASNNYQVQHADESRYENRFRCVRKSIPYRLKRNHNCVETKIFGIQTATVVGPAGEEIHTDEFGRVRVQFHWDRIGQNDENSSAWLRVATPWAGQNFGFTSIPRIGTEVIVQFLDGNPDRPIITGMVPNASTMPPWTLPDNKTQSGILSRSTPKGQYDHANALRFEDKKGAEQLWLHAEKDQLTEVEHDEDKWVGNDRRKTIDRDETSHIKRDRTETVDRDERITVHNNRTERVDHDESISVGDNRTEDVGANETISIGQNRTEQVGGDEKITIGGSRHVLITMAKTETVGLAKALTIGAAYQTSVGGAMNTTVGLSQSEQVVLSKSVDVGKTFAITVADEFSIEVGDSTFVMRKDGRIEITGKEIIIKGSRKVELHGDDVDVNPGG